MHILRVYKKYSYSLDSLHHFVHSVVVPLFTHGISVFGAASYDKHLSKIDKFHLRKELFVLTFSRRPRPF